MKKLKVKKIKIAKINNLNMIFGGNNEVGSYRQTIVNNCLPDTFTCPPKETEDPNDTTCHTTNAGTLKTQGGLAETDGCGG